MIAPRMYRSILLAGLTAVVVLSCAHNVPQDQATGADGRVKGAKALTFDNGEAKASGIVTYPGGDRVDWKVVELPDKARGVMEIKLSWNPPRPGLQLAFDVFDEWNQPVLNSKRSTKKKSRKRTKSATLDNAKGKYFIRVYAVDRGDAGKYKLTVNFSETIAGPVWNPKDLEIQDPPKLAAIPEAEATCDEFAFDPKNPACRGVCPASGAPQGWPACAGKCPNPPDINIEACWRTMPCPNPPDRRVKACRPSQWPPCDLKAPDPNNPRCDNANYEPIVARIVKNEITNGQTIITIGAGSEQGIQKGWTARVLRGDGDAPMSSGEVTIIRIGKRDTVGSVHLTTDQLQSNDRVKFSPPAR